MLAAAKSDAIGAIYAASAKDAVDGNIIGSPCYVLDGEVFWGQDRLMLLESALASGRKAYRMDATV
jgi:2-hydroxychromene-2-carboxylate isomerase